MSQRKRVRHVCPACGQIRYLQPSDAAKTKYCRHCHCQQIASLGFQATAAKKGRDFAIRAAANKRKQHPSTLEAQVEAALCEISGIAWEREYAIEREGRNPYYVDFAIQIGHSFIALEVNGSFAHRQSSDADSLRIDTLFLYFDDVIVLTEEEITSAVLLPEHIRQQLFQTSS
ncbi:MAG: hypothetical protein JNJ61_25035 [Anaerolineae bacterium]|nr:hypothetical protein [Anaerolineae bacterium]